MSVQRTQKTPQNAHVKVLSSGLNCAYLVVLIGSHGNEIRFRKNIRPEGAVRELENVVGSHDVKPRLIFVHGVEYGLQQSWYTQYDAVSPDMMQPRVAHFLKMPHVINRNQTSHREEG